MSDQAVKFRVNEAGIPRYMRDQARFCFWRLIKKDNGDVTKIPFNPNAPKLGAQTNHPETFGTLAQAMTACQKFGGSGIGVNLQDGLWAIDVDHCIDAQGHMSEMAIDIIRTMNSPVEYSPRGGGLHIYFRADHADFLPENYYFNNRKVELEVYPSGLTNRFMTVTGNHLPGTPEDIEGDRSVEVMAVLERYMKREHPKSGASAEGGGISFLSDGEVIDKATASKNAEKFYKLWQGSWEGDKYPSHSEADAALCTMLAFWCNKDAAQMDRLFRQSGLMRPKWESSRASTTYGALTIWSAVDYCENTYHPKRMPEDVPDDLPPFIRIDSKGIPHVICPLLADYIRDKVIYKLVRDSGKHSLQIYVYENGVYRLYAPDMFQGIIRDIIADYSRELVAMRDVKETYDQLIKDRNYIRQEDLNSDESVINFRNGLLKVTASSVELMPHSPEVLSTIQIPCDWTGMEHPTPVFDSFLDTLTNHRPEIIRFLLQWLGVVISNVRGYRCKKALIMHGPGDTGKSILKSFAEHLLGKGNYIGIDLAEIEARFGTSAIFGMRLAGSSDMSYVTVKELKTFKKITGGDSLFAEFKGQQGFEFVYAGLLWFCTNKPPKFGGDDGKWVYDRIMILECPNSIPKNQQDKMLLDKLYTESEGIIHKAVKALQLFLRNAFCFDEPESMQKARDAYRAENSSVISFFQECMTERGEVRFTDQMRVLDLYKVYEQWCKDNENGYAKGFKDFKTQLAEHLGVEDFRKLCVHRNTGTYMRDYRLNDETMGAYGKTM